MTVQTVVSDKGAKYLPRNTSLLQQDTQYLHGSAA